MTTTPAGGPAGLATVAQDTPAGAGVIAMLRAVLDTLPVGAGLVEATGEFRLLYSNRAHEALLPAGGPPPAGRPLADALPGVKAADVLRVLGSVVATGEVGHLPGGVAGDWAVHPLPAAGGSIEHLLLVCSGPANGPQVGPASAGPWVRALLDTTDAIWAVQAREELPRVAVEQGRGLIPGVDVGIGLRVPGSPWRLEAVAASLPALQDLLGRQAGVTETGPGGIVLAGGRPFETTTAGAHSERLRRAGVDTMRLVPLVSGIGPAAEPEPLGLLGFFRSGAEPFAELERHLMDEFAKRLSLALHRVQLLDTANRRARQLQTAVEEARAASLAKTRFMNMAAHELRTPLAAIAGYASMLDDGTFGQLDGRLRRPIDAIVAKTAELGGLIEDILTASRLESGDVQVVRERLDLCQVVRRVARRLQPRRGQGSGRLRHGLPAEPVWALADGTHVERILEVLVDNALKYADGVPDVLLTAGAETEAVVRVEDRGIGIEPDHQERVFERFYRVDDPAAGWFPPGTGLGLAIGRELAELNGGTVVLERSGRGTGSVFALRLPLA